GALVRCGNAVVDLPRSSAVKVVAIGKASHTMVEGLASVLGPDRSFEGIVSAPVAPKNGRPAMRYFVGGHPVPNQASLDAAEEILRFLARCSEETLVIFLLSGGGSALSERLLVPGTTLEDVQRLHHTLVTCGASIDAINSVRKHFSAVKGGRLAAAAPHPVKLTGAVSDVPRGRESALASGPTIPDPTTRAEVERVIAEYSLREKLPARIREWLARNDMPETPKAGDPAFARSLFHLLLGVDDLFHPAHT